LSRCGSFDGYEVTNNGLIKLTTKEGTALLVYSFPTNESIQLISISNKFFGTFYKQ
jgi:hypothetical protein